MDTDNKWSCTNEKEGKLARCKIDESLWKKCFTTMATG